MVGEAPSTGSLPNNWIGVIITLLLVVGATAVHLPLEGERPTIHSKLVRQPGKVDARLWQDPFEAVRQASTAQAEQPDGVSVRLRVKADDVTAVLLPGGTEAASGAAHARADDSVLWARTLDPVSSGGDKSIASTSIRLMAVLAHKDGIGGEEEDRRRLRYAVVSALMQQGYAPHDAEHLLVLSKALAGLNKRYYPESIPYEIFDLGKSGSSDRGLPGRIVVLWIDEGVIDEPAAARDRSVCANPQQRVAYLFKTLLKLGKRSSSEAMSYTLLGPSDSTTLAAMAQPLDRQCDHSAPEVLRTLQVISPVATAPWRELSISLKTGCYRSAAVCLDEMEGVGQFIRAIPTDDKVVDAISDELSRRCIQKTDRIAIVAQSDTQYSRILRDLIASHYRNIDVYGYLRGLDGRLPGEEQSAASDDKQTGDQRALESTAQELVSGNPQTDYLRRLVLSMHAARDSESSAAGDSNENVPWHCALTRFSPSAAWHALAGGPGSEEPYRAIAVIGDDYYDKVLALRALRPEFPRAVFFTTDLHAGMLHPIDNALTRNLIVGSGFGLSPEPPVWRADPPEKISGKSVGTSTSSTTTRALPPLKPPVFRDVYQASAYRATVLSLQPFELISNEMIAPAVFEVGLKSFYRLSPECENAKNCPRLPVKDWFSDNGRSGQPDIAAGLRWLIAFGCLLLPVMILLLYPPLRRGLATECKCFGRSDGTLSNRGGWWLAIVLLAIIAVSILAIHDINSLGEPLAWSNGLSVWPSELIRGLALLVASIGILHAARVASTQDRMMSEYSGDQGEGGEFQFEWNPFGDGELRSAIGCQFLWLSLTGFICWCLLGSDITVPARSSIAYWIDICLTPAVMIALLIQVVMVRLLSSRVLRLTRIQRDGLRTSVWFRTRARSQASTELNSSSANIAFQDPGSPQGSMNSASTRASDALTALRQIANLTECAQSLFYYPFGALALVVLGRLRIFDNWTTSGAGLVFVLIVFGYLLLAGIRLRLSVESLRGAVLNNLDAGLDRLILTSPPSDAEVARVGHFMDAIRQVNGGAFMQLTQQPPVRAALALASGVSGGLLAQKALLSWL